MTTDALAGPRPGMMPAAGTPLSARLAGLGRRLIPDAGADVDAGAAFLLTALAVLGLRTTYWGWSWLVLALLGAALGIVVAHVGATFGWPGAGTVLLWLAAYFLLGGPIAMRDHLAVGVFPTGRTFHDLAVVPVSGWKLMLTSVPPLDSRAPMIVLPFVSAMSGAALVYGVARAWRTAPAALAVPIGLLVLSILLGTITPASLLLQGVVFAVLLLIWAALRASRGRPALQNGAGRLTRLITAAILLALAATGAWFLGPRLPGSAADAASGGATRTVWRTSLVPPFDVAQYPSPLAGFRRYTKPNPAKLYHTTLFTVSGLPAGTPVRIASLDQYDGSVWGAGNQADDGSPNPGAGFRHVGSHITTADVGTPAVMTVRVPSGGYAGVWMPTAGVVNQVVFGGPAAAALADQLEFNTDTQTAVLPSGLRPGEAYSLGVDLPARTGSLPSSLDTAEGQVTDTSNFTFLDALINKYGGTGATAWQQLASVTRQMRASGAYTDGGTPGSFQRVYLPGHSIGRLDDFASAQQLAGDDEQYAAALALLGNRLGIPTRAVLGAIPERDGTVKGADVHAWVEVRKSDGTWYPVLPSQFLPDRNKAPKPQQRKTTERRVGIAVPPPPANNPPSFLQGPDQAQNDTNVKHKPQAKKKKQHNILDPTGWPRWVQLVAALTGIPLALLLLTYLVLVALKGLRRYRRRTTGPPVGRIAAGWKEVLDTARELRVPVPDRATRAEQAQALGQARPGADGVGPLAQTADAYVFGAEDPDLGQASAYWQQVRSVRRQLRRTVGWWRRRRADIALARRAGRGRHGRRGRPTVVSAPAGSIEHVLQEGAAT